MVLDDTESVIRTARFGKKKSTFQPQVLLLLQTQLPSLCLKKVYIQMMIHLQKDFFFNLKNK